MSVRLEQLRNELASVAQLGPIELRLRAAGSDGSGKDPDIVDVVHDSRRVTAGCLFCAVPGASVDGHRFVDGAVQAGAAAVLVERELPTEAPQLIVRDVRSTMAHAAAAVHGHPSRELDLFGITGTNGKTTTTQLFAGILSAAGRRCEVIGTLGGVHTTPESTDLQRRLRELADGGVDSLALEVSSHALDQHRADATSFAVAAFSNLTPDHLDYHGDMETYFDAKKRLFDGRARIELVNVDDAWGQRLADERPDARRIRLDPSMIVDEAISGSRYRWRDQVIAVPLPGRMNVANALMAAEAAEAIGLEPSTIAAGIASAPFVPGRMQAVPRREGQPTVIVDYSHTPDSIERALATLRSVAPTSQIAIVFGCGGDRDRTKRPLMARAAEAADRVYITSDNPRSEDPLVIIEDAMTGFSDPDEVIVEPDRELAIRRAIIDSRPDGVVLVAGKGHEKTQTIGSDVLPFDDVSVAADVLEARET